MDSWVFSVIDVVCPKRIKYNLSVLEVSETEVSSLVKHIRKCQIRPSKYHQNVLHIFRYYPNAFRLKSF